MADRIATLFKFRQYVFEYGPLFVAAWLRLAITTIDNQLSGIRSDARPVLLRSKPLQAAQTHLVVVHRLRGEVAA